MEIFVITFFCRWEGSEQRTGSFRTQGFYCFGFWMRGGGVVCLFGREEYQVGLVVFVGRGENYFLRGWGIFRFELDRKFRWSLLVVFVQLFYFSEVFVYVLFIRQLVYIQGFFGVGRRRRKGVCFRRCIVCLGNGKVFFLIDWLGLGGGYLGQYR